jgi:hypothetical protein
MPPRVRWLHGSLKSDLEYSAPWSTAEGGWIIFKLKPPGRNATYHPKRRDPEGNEVESLGHHLTIASAKRAVENRIRRGS